MRIEHRGRLTAHMIALAAFVILLAACARNTFGQAATDRAATADDQACSPLIQEGVVSDKLSPITGRQIHLSVEGHQALLFLSAHNAPRSPLDWVWFAPMVPTQPNKHHAFIIQHVLDAGMAFAAINVGESYGNPEGTRIYTEFHDVLHGR